MELKRKIYDRMLKWKQEDAGCTALLLEGAHRVGKSHIVEQFGKREYKSYLLIDFSNVSKQILDVFENDFTEYDIFFSKLSVFYGVKLFHRESLIIFDEVQMYPKARQMIKHLVADGRYDYIETGSLLTLKQNVESIVLPSEEEHVSMYPLDFEEFLWAMGDEVTVPYMKDCFDKRKPMGEAIHRKTMNLFRQYMLVGGMPQSVVAFIETKDFEKADRAKRRILNLYRNDVTKFAKGYESKVLSIFDGIPSQLSKHEKKYSLASIQKEARFREYEDAFMWLDEAMIINTCFNSSDPNVGLRLNEERIGLNEGMFFENMAAQMLRSRGHKLYFYSRSDRKNSENRMEIDFLISKKRKICPLEVKSSAYKNHVSLDKFKNKFSAKTGERYIIYTKDLKVEGDVVCLPIYMLLFL